MTGSHWFREHGRGSASVLHDPAPPVRSRPTVRVLEVDAASLVLGSSQATDIVDLDRAREAGVQVATRRSGGGAVLLVPGEHVWIDVWVPRGSRWWNDDVVRAVDWLSVVWIDALEGIEVADLVVHRDAMTRTRWSDQVCFAGVGPGEVLAGGRKLVGISQRRTRDWVRYQCAVHRRWDADATFALLRDDEARRGANAWRDGVAVVGDLDIETAVVEALHRA